MFSQVCLTLSAVSWPPAGAFSWASGFDSLCEEGAVALGPATSLSLASVFDLLPSTLESPSASVSFGRLGEALQKGWQLSVWGTMKLLYFFFFDRLHK